MCIVGKHGRAAVPAWPALWLSLLALRWRVSESKPDAGRALMVQQSNTMQEINQIAANIRGIENFVPVVRITAIE